MIPDTSPWGIGAKLQDARQRGGISLRQVGDSTKIPITILQALERNDISGLPGGLYSRGFVRSFAIAVALDPEATVAEFVAQFPLGSVTCGYPAAERVDVNDVSHARRPNVSSPILWSQASTLLRLATVGVLPAALVVYLGTTKGMPQWPAMRGSIATQVGPGDTVGVGVPGEVFRAPSAGEIVVHTQRSDGSPALSGETRLPVPVNVPADFAVAPAVRAGDHSIPVAASRPLMDFARDSSPANAESSAGAYRSEKPDAGSLVRNPVAVMLAASSPSWVIATVDGKKIVNRLFQVGEQESLEARHDLVLTAGDAGAIVMTLNGRLAKSLGRPGQTITVRVSSTNFRDYLRR